jgi:hypothetical protein
MTRTPVAPKSEAVSEFISGLLLTVGTEPKVKIVGGRLENSKQIRFCLLRNGVWVAGQVSAVDAGLFWKCKHIHVSPMEHSFMLYGVQDSSAEVVFKVVSLTTDHKLLSEFGHGQD